MAGLTAPINLLTPTAGAPAHAKTRAEIEATAQKFEATFLSQMLGQMFQGVTVSEPFGGGDGETAFKSFLMDAFAEATTKRGGIGLAKPIMAEMLKLQGLNEA